MAEIEFPEKFAFLFEPHRFKVAYGGRDGVKSWSIAAALIIMAAQRPLRILCCREVQSSIKESVHQTLCGQIQRMGLQEQFRILETSLIGTTEYPVEAGSTANSHSEFIFTGLSNKTAAQIKSYEGIDITWVEEAENVTKKSWEILQPTIRKPGSEIWVSFNPRFVDDETYKRWIVNTPPGTVLVETGWEENLWLSAESRMGIEHLRATDLASFEHIYGGKPRSTVVGAIYADEIARADKERRISSAPYDTTRAVDTYWDLGFADMVSIWFAQPVGLQFRVIDYFQDSFKSIDFYLQILQSRGYTYGTVYLPWDGGAKQLGTGRSIEELIRAKGFKTRVMPQAGVADGINAVRTIFPQLWFDAEKCAVGIDGLRRYQWGEPSKNGADKRAPLHDQFSHCFTGDTEVLTRLGSRRIMDLAPEGEVLTSCGWEPYRSPRITRERADLVEVRFMDGLRVKCTPDHLFMTETGWRSAESLTSGTQIQSSLLRITSGSPASILSVGKARSISSQRQTESLNEFYTERYGVPLLGQSPKNAIFTIETLIPRITASPILSASTHANIVLSPGDQLIHDLFGMHRLLLRLGMHLQRVLNGIENMLCKLAVGKNSKGLNLLVAIAGASSWLCSALEDLESGVVRNAKTPPIVQSVARLRKPEDVWCITVPGSEQFSLKNGAIVHNCADALRCLAMSIKTPEKPPPPKGPPKQRPYGAPYTPFG